MFRRVIATVLWGYFGWYLGSLVATFAGLPALIGPVIGIAIALVAVIDWRRPRIASTQAATEVLGPSR